MHKKNCTFLGDGIIAHCDCGARERGLAMLSVAMGMPVHKLEKYIAEEAAIHEAVMRAINEKEKDHE
jgi:hypothetical protein